MENKDYVIYSKTKNEIAIIKVLGGVLIIYGEGIDILGIYNSNIFDELNIIGEL